MVISKSIKTKKTAIYGAILEKNKNNEKKIVFKYF
jgi:hypothetical protein